MKIDFFYHAIKAAMEKHANIPLIQYFLENIEILFADKKSELSLVMTRMTILFEGFYRFLPNDSNLKKELLSIRLQRWSGHFGTPTLTFFLSYQIEIDETCDQYKRIENVFVKLATPWKINQSINQCKLDEVNNIVVNMKTVSEVVLSEQQEITGQFIKTHNPIGGFTTTPCDPYSQKFIEYATSLVKSNGRVLEIGAAFGAASLPILAKGVTVFCNDIEPQNLAVIRKRYLQHNNKQDYVTGDSEKLILVPGAFPDELLALPKESFDAILVCRVLHFFTGDKIEQALKKMANLLKSGGKLFIVCETPFLKNWQRFVPEYEKRVAKKIEWPGEITNPSEFESSGRSASLPTFVHWITKDILDRSLLRANLFEIEQSTYIDRQGQFPDDLILSGKESVGAVAIKI